MPLRAYIHLFLLACLSVLSNHSSKHSQGWGSVLYLHEKLNWRVTHLTTEMHVRFGQDWPRNCEFLARCLCRCLDQSCLNIACFLDSLTLISLFHKHLRVVFRTVRLLSALSSLDYQYCSSGHQILPAAWVARVQLNEQRLSSTRISSETDSIWFKTEKLGLSTSRTTSHNRKVKSLGCKATLHSNCTPDRNFSSVSHL